MDVAAALTLACGPDRAAAGQWLAGRFAGRPVGERWAALADAPLPVAIPTGPDVVVRSVSGGCFCCAGALVLRTELVGLLRWGPWRRVFVVTGPDAAPAQVAAGLLVPSLAGHLALERIVIVEMAGSPAGRLPPQWVTDAREAAQAAGAVFERAAAGG